MIELWILSISLAVGSLIFDIIAIRWHRQEQKKRKRIYLNLPDHVIPREAAEQLIEEIVRCEADEA